MSSLGENIHGSRRDYNRATQMAWAVTPGEGWCREGVRTGIRAPRWAGAGHSGT